MQAQNAYNAYKKNSVTTASPGELTLMLYNGCIKFLHQSKKALETKDIETKNINLKKAQAIISELMITLNMDIPLSKQMFSLYEYMNYRLKEANIHNDSAMIAEVEGYIVELRDSWKEAIQINRQKSFSGNKV